MFGPDYWQASDANGPARVHSSTKGNVWLSDWWGSREIGRYCRELSGAGQVGGLRMLSVVGEGYSESELGTQILNEEVGNGFLARLQRRRRKKLSEMEAVLPKFLRNGAKIANGKPAEIVNYDPAEDAIVFAYDPDQTPEPVMELRNGKSCDDKLLFMNGKLVVQFANSRLLTILDINVIETKITQEVA